MLLFMKKFLLVFTFLLFLLQLQAQDHIPYYHSFEDSQANENANWVLNFFPKGEQFLVNKWYLGNLLSSDGAKSIYMSSDNGVSHSYNPAQSNTIIAYRVFDIQTPGTYDLSFDWMAFGEGTSYLMVAWIDNDIPRVQCMTSPTAYQLIADEALTTENGESQLKRSSVWKNEITQITVAAGKKYKLVFAWYNPTGVVKNPPGAVDNISITSRNCARVADLDVDVDGTTANVTWSGTADSYGIKYKAYGEANWIQSTSTTTSKTYSNLASGVYDFAVRSVCNGDTGVWIYFDKILVYNALCIDYIDLESADATSGTYSNPFASKGVVDFGYEKITSRHTIHFVPGEVDPRTGGQLPTVPPGEVASVRLGNWNSGAKAESITYEYTVDANVAAVMLLKYAVILEAPGNHSTSEQPQFQLDILDEFDNKLDATCTSALFTGTESNVGSNGWYLCSADIAGTASPVVWKDWTTVGVNLAPYHGRTIKIRLITYDCSLSAHMGYAYFTLGCTTGKLEGVNCGDMPTDSFVAPIGFNYEWYVKNNPNSILSTDRVFHVNSDDTTTYAVDVIFPEAERCRFTLYASATPRFPRAQASCKYVAENCTYSAYLKNESHIYTEFSDSTGEELESTYWIYPDGTINTDKDIVYEAPNDGSSVSLKLVASIGAGVCSDTTLVNIQAPSILRDTIQKFTWKICRGDYFNFASEQLTESGVYADTLITVAGCDSISELTLDVIDNIQTTLFDTICVNEKYTFGDTTLNIAGVYVDSLINYLGCDSIVTLNLQVLDVLSFVADDNIIACADDSIIEIPISITDGTADSLLVEFSDDAIAQGFSDDSIEYENSILTIYPPVNVRPNIYTFDLTLTNSDCGAMTSPIKISIYYPSSIVEQKWNNVLALLNDRYNGGYTFSSYQWYCNGTAIKNAEGSYFYLGNDQKFSTSDEYHVLLTRADDNVTMPSCPIIPVTKVDANDYLTGATTRVGMGDSFSIPQIDNEANYTVRIYTSLGSLVSVQRVGDANSYITAPNLQGIYIVTLELSTGITSYKLFVE